MTQEIVTIDGPSGVGKSTISRKVAVALGYTYLDTGAMYRTVALRVDIAGVDESDTSALQQCLDEIQLELIPAQNANEDVGVLLFGEDVSREIRTPEMAMVASRVSALPQVREKLTQMQRKIGEAGKIVAEGRDTGTVVFPGAANKFFLDAKPEIRAERRVLQLEASGKSVDKQELLQMIIERDKNDRERAVAPLKMADDGVYIDTSNLTIEEVTEQIIDRIKSSR